MEALVPFGFHITPDIKIKFVKDPAGLVKGIMDSSEGPKEVKVVLSEGEKVCAQKVQRLLQNQFLEPTYYPVVNEVKFESTLAPDRGWTTYRERPYPNPWPYGKEKEKIICRLDGMISYCEDNKVFTWDWMMDSFFQQVYEGKEITAIAENPEGHLVVGSKEGKLYVLGKEYDTQIQMEIDTIIPLSSSIYVIKFCSNSLVIFDTESQSVLKTENSFSWLLEDGAIVSEAGNFYHNATNVTIKRFNLSSKEYETQNHSFLCSTKIHLHCGKFFSVYRSNKNKRGTIGVWDPKTDQHQWLHGEDFYNHVLRDSPFIVLKKDPVHPGPLFERSCCEGIQLSNGYIMYATDGNQPRAGKGIHVIDAHGKVFSSQFKELIRDRWVKRLEELTKGYVFVLYQGSMAILKPRDVAGDAAVQEVCAKRPRLMPVVDPGHLESYIELAKMHGEQHYRVLLSGLQSAMKVHFDVYHARRFYEKARRLRERDRELCTVFLSHLQYTFNMKLRKQVQLDLSRITGDVKNLEPWIQKGFKRRLFFIEGSCASMEDLLRRHNMTHPNLAASILVIGNFLAESLKEQKVQVRSDVDPTTIDQVFTGERFKRIHWNGKQDKKIVAQFFQAASKLQLVKDRIHVALNEEQREVPLTRIATYSGYRLIRKRHLEFVFEKIRGAVPEEKNLVQDALSLKDSHQKEYDVKMQGEEAIFVCSTDDDSSDYYESD